MRVLVAPLNWGLGHATRCIPIIHQLLQENHEVIIAADGYPLRLLQQEFPSLELIELPSYQINYSKGKSQVFAMLKSVPKILGGIYREHHQLKKIIEKYKVEQVISDNRFGMWNKHIESIYITHQLMIKMPKYMRFLEPLVWWMHRLFINRYDVCWIPDYEGENNLSGDLAHKYTLPKHAKFIGPQSRFSLLLHQTKNKLQENYETVAVLSGPEPQRSIFEKQIVNCCFADVGKCLIVRGLPNDSSAMEYIGDNIAMVSHLDSENLAYHLQQAKKIICRSGYSSIMDLHVLNCLHKAELHPTPGQTEQEYLAIYHQNREEIDVTLSLPK